MRHIKNKSGYLLYRQWSIIWHKWTFTKLHSKLEWWHKWHCGTGIFIRHNVTCITHIFSVRKLMLQVKQIFSILDRSCLNTHVVRLFIQHRRCILDLRRDFWFKETNYLATTLLTIPVTFQFSRTIRSQLDKFVFQTLLLMTKDSHQAFVVLYNSSSLKEKK